MRGGAIYIDSNVSTLLLTIEGNSLFNANRSTDGTIRIDSGSLLDAASVIRNTDFTLNDNLNAGVIYSEFKKGVLTLNNVNFTQNKSVIGTVLYTSHAQDTDTDRSLIRFESCTFSANTGTSVLYLFNGNVYSTVETDTCTFNSNDGPVVKVEYGLYIDNSSTYSGNTG